MRGRARARSPERVGASRSERERAHGCVIRPIDSPAHNFLDDFIIRLVYSSPLELPVVASRLEATVKAATKRCQVRGKGINYGSRRYRQEARNNGSFYSSRFYAAAGWEGEGREKEGGRNNERVEMALGREKDIAYRREGMQFAIPVLAWSHERR